MPGGPGTPWSRNSLAEEALDPADPPRIYPDKSHPATPRASTTRFRVMTLYKGPVLNSSRYLASRGCYSTPGCGKAGERAGTTCAMA